MRLTPQQVVGDVLERYKAHLALRPASTGSDAAFHFVPPRPAHRRPKSVADRVKGHQRGPELEERKE